MSHKCQSLTSAKIKRTRWITRLQCRRLCCLKCRRYSSTCRWSNKNLTLRWLRGRSALARSEMTRWLIFRKLQRCFEEAANSMHQFNTHLESQQITSSTYLSRLLNLVNCTSITICRKEHILRSFGILRWPRITRTTHLLLQVCHLIKTIWIANRISRCIKLVPTLLAGQFHRKWLTFVPRSLTRRSKCKKIQVACNQAKSSHLKTSMTKCPSFCPIATRMVLKSLRATRLGITRTS